MFYEFLYAFSLIAQNEKIEFCKNSLRQIILKDLSNRLNYMPYVGYSWCCVVTNAIEEAIIYINKIPDTNVLQDFTDRPWCCIFVELNSILEALFADIASNLKDKSIISRIQMLEALYIYSPSETYDINRFTKKNLSTLATYYCKHRDNLEVAYAVFHMQKHFKQYTAAYKTFVEMLQNHLDVDKKYLSGLDFLDECPVYEVTQIYQHITSVLKSQLDMNMTSFVELVFDDMTEYLWGSDEKEKYQKIVDMATLIDICYLKKSKVLFEIAYSHAKLDSKSISAEKIYTLILEQEPRNSSVLNNLGVIFEKRSDLEKAFEYFKKAFDLDGADEIHNRNLSRVSEQLKNFQNALC